MGHSFSKYYTTNQKVKDSIPDGVTEISHWCNPSGSSKTPGSTQ
jgi:hypothetical protein